MNCVLAGQKWFGVEVLRVLVRRGWEIKSVFAPAGDRLELFADQHAIPVGEPRTIEHNAPAADLLVCAHHHGFVGAGLRARYRLGALGYHPSFLPRHRGRDAVEWAVRFSDPIAGGAVYWMNDIADGGPIAAREAIHVLPGETAPDLWRRALAPLGVKLFERVFADLERGVVTAEPQDERVATFEPAIGNKTLSGGTP